MQSVFDVLTRLVGGMNRPKRLEVPANPDSILLVDAIRSTDEEQGAFLTAAGVTSVRLAVNASCITADQDDPNPKTKVFLYSHIGHDGRVLHRGILNPGDENIAPSMTPGLTVSACVYNDKGRLTKEFVFSTDEWAVGHIWVNNETTVELTLVPVDQLAQYNAALKVGHGDDKPGGRLYDANDGRDTAFGILQAAVGFGTGETQVRAAEVACDASAGVILAESGLFNQPYQIISEEMIDAVTQFDLGGVGKASKRLNTLDRTAQVNNVVYVQDESDKMVFFMFEPGTVPECYKYFDTDKLMNMQGEFFDGCILVSKACMMRLRDMMEQRYDRLGMNVEKGLLKFDAPFTYQIRISGGGLVDQHGEAIGMQGHLKTHIMIAGGVVDEWMEENGIDFLGTSDALKTDLAVTREDVIAVVVQPKNSKLDLHTSAQHYSAAALQHQNREDYLLPRREQFLARLKEIEELAYDEDAAMAALESMKEEIEEGDDDLLGEVRRGANEVLATYATLGLRVTDSPAAIYALQTNMLQRLGYATLDDAKNKDMSTGGFGRRIDMPAAGVYMQIFPEAFIHASGNWCPEVKQGKMYTYSYKDGVIGIISNRDWMKFLSLTGDGDLDDFWNAYFTKRGNKRQALVMRHPAVRGEYMVFDLVNSKALLEIWTPHEENGFIPSIDPAKLATRLDRVRMPNGKALAPMTLKDAHVQIFGGDPDTYTREDALTVMKTYVQQISVAMTVVLGRKALRGEDTWIETSFFVGRPVPDLNNVTVDEFVNSRSMVGPIRGTMRSLLMGIEKHNSETEAFWSQMRPGIDLVPEAGGTFLEYALRTMHAVIKRQMDRGELGGVTYIRNSMEAWLKRSLQLIVVGCYNDHGISIKDTDAGYAYDTEGASQAKLHVLSVPRVDELFQGEVQPWKEFTNRGQYFTGRKNLSILPTNLETSELGSLVLNSEIGRFVPAASWVRFVYSKRYDFYNDAWDRQSKDPDVARPLDLISRRAWLDALATVREDIDSMEDLYQFTLALYFVLRATPQVSIRKLTNSIREVFGQPGNVFAERLLYTSPLMRWTEEGDNVVLSAFQYAQENRAALMSTDAHPVVPVLVTDGPGRQFIVFVTDDGGSIQAERL